MGLFPYDHHKTFWKAGIVPGTASAGGGCSGDVATIGQVQQPNTIEGSAGFVGADLGDDHGCVIRGDGKIFCWGSNNLGQLGISTSTTSQPSLANATAVATNIYPLSLSAGGNHTCAVDTNGSAWCWGQGSSGELGNGSPNSSYTPVQFNVGGAHVRAMAAGLSSTCALLTDGTVFCSGLNGNGQLGNNSTVDSNSPVQVKIGSSTMLTQVTQIAAGDHHFCALTVSGAVYCWGAADASGGTQTVLARYVTNSNDSTGFSTRAITAGGSFSCAVMSDGTARCWGVGTNGQLGDGLGTTSASMVTVSGVSNAVSIGAGVTHACAVMADGSMKCWGDDSSGQQGNGSTTGNINTPATVNPGSAVIAALGGYQHACALTQDGIYCWGSDASGQIGDGSTTTGTQTSPVAAPMPPHQTWVPAVPVGFYANSAATFQRGRILDVGDNHACMVVPAGSFVNEGNVSTATGAASSRSTETRVACWGKNNVGQLGGGTTTEQHRPRFVTTALTGAPVSVATGAEHSCALTATGSVFCWGSGASGKIGQTTDSSAPVQVSGVSNAVAITAGSNHTCALLANGRVSCWGENSQYQLGVMNTTDSASPVTVTCRYCGLTTPPPLESVVAISAGGEHTCAVTAFGQVRCWGRNNLGQAARPDDDTADIVPEGEGSNVRGAQPALTNWIYGSGTGYETLLGSTMVSVTAGANHTCAVTYGGDSFCWGSNNHRQVSGASTASFRNAQSMWSRRPDVLGMSAGGDSTCALHRSASSGSAIVEVSCWGANGSGQAGYTVGTDVSTTWVVGTSGGSTLGDTQVRVATGGTFSCALSFNGQVNCWGLNDVGQHGDSTNNTSMAGDQQADAVIDLQ